MLGASQCRQRSEELQYPAGASCDSIGSCHRLSPFSRCPGVLRVPGVLNEFECMRLSRQRLRRPNNFSSYLPPPKQHLVYGVRNHEYAVVLMNRVPQPRLHRVSCNVRATVCSCRV